MGREAKTIGTGYHPSHQKQPLDLPEEASHDAWGCDHLALVVVGGQVSNGVRDLLRGAALTVLDGAIARRTSRRVEFLRPL